MLIIRSIKENYISNVSSYLIVQIIVTIVYLFSAKGYIEVSDTSYSIATAEAIFYRGELEIPHDESATLQGANGRSFSKYGIGLPLYFLPWIAISDVISKLSHYPAKEISGFFISFANIPFGILTLHIFRRCLLRIDATERVSIMLVFGLGLCTLLWKYSTYDFSESMQACFLLMVVSQLLIDNRRNMLCAGIAFSILILVKLVHMAFLPVFVSYIFAVTARPFWHKIQYVLWFMLPVILALGFLGYLNQVRFGSPLESGYGKEAGQFIFSQLWWTLPSLLFGLDKGLIVFCPILLFGFFGWRAFFRKHRAAVVMFASLIVMNLVLAGAWHSWIGGWSWGPRLLVPTIPLWLLPAAFVLDELQSIRSRVIYMIVVLVSISMQSVGILIKDQQIHHIKQQILTDQEREFVASDYASAWILLTHKLHHRYGEEIYNVSEFSDSGDRQFDLTQHKTFRGINVWTEHTARKFNSQSIRLLPLFGLFAVIACLSILLKRTLKSSN